MLAELCHSRDWVSCLPDTLQSLSAWDNFQIVLKHFDWCCMISNEKNGVRTENSPKASLRLILLRDQFRLRMVSGDPCWWTVDNQTLRSVSVAESQYHSWWWTVGRSWRHPAPRTQEHQCPYHSYERSRQHDCRSEYFLETSMRRARHYQLTLWWRWRLRLVANY